MLDELSGEKQHRVVHLHIQLPMDFPIEWDDDLINFHMNESSWCCSNFIDELEKYDKEHGCICSICYSEVLPKGTEIESEKIWYMDAYKKFENCRIEN